VRLCLSASSAVVVEGSWDTVVPVGIKGSLSLVAEAMGLQSGRMHRCAPDRKKGGIDGSILFIPVWILFFYLFYFYFTKNLLFMK
jgi:hypothetical protein